MYTLGLELHTNDVKFRAIKFPISSTISIQFDQDLAKPEEKNQEVQSAGAPSHSLIRDEAQKVAFDNHRTISKTGLASVPRPLAGVENSSPVLFPSVLVSLIFPRPCRGENGLAPPAPGEKSSIS